MFTRWLFQPSGFGILVDETGRSVERGADANELQVVSPTVLRSTRAFSARAEPATTETTSSPQPDKQTAPINYNNTDKRAVTFLIESPTGQSPVLVGVAPADTPLDTPMTWEHPGAYFVECSDRGAFAWSESAGVFGVRVAERCCSRDLVATGSSALVTVEWGGVYATCPENRSVRFTVRDPGSGELRGQQCMALASTLEGAVVSGRDLFPHATLVCSGVKVTLVS